MPGHLIRKSREPASQVYDLMPGDVFVHRTINHVAARTCLDALSTIQEVVA